MCYQVFFVFNFDNLFSLLLLKKVRKIRKNQKILENTDFSETPQQQKKTKQQAPTLIN